MYHSINAGRLRDYVQIFEQPTESDAFGQPAAKVQLFDARAEVKTVSGDKVQNYGTTTTSTIITVLMWFDTRAENDQVLLFNGVEFTVNHIKPDEVGKSMILTCQSIKK